MSDAVASVRPSPFAAPPGGVMTREVGAISGELEAWLDPADPQKVRVRYVGALDVYTVKGKAAGRGIEAVVAALSDDPGLDVDGNPLPVDLAAPATPGAAVGAPPRADAGALPGAGAVLGALGAAAATPATPTPPQFDVKQGV